MQSGQLLVRNEAGPANGMRETTTETETEAIRQVWDGAIQIRDQTDGIAQARAQGSKGVLEAKTHHLSLNAQQCIAYMVFASEKRERQEGASKIYCSYYMVFFSLRFSGAYNHFSGIRRYRVSCRLCGVGVRRRAQCVYDHCTSVDIHPRTVSIRGPDCSNLVGSKLDTRLLSMNRLRG
jgi:hypothetical protein